MHSKSPIPRRARPALSCSVFFLLIASLPLTAHAQSAEISTTPQPAIDAPTPHPAAQPSEPAHRFWDKQNDWLFAGVAASRTLDYFSTLNMRRRGRQEILLTNDVVDNHPAFAVIEAAGTGVSIAGSYIFHRYGHHTLERWTSVVHIGLATGGAIRNYSLKTAHFAATPGSTPIPANATLIGRHQL